MRHKYSTICKIIWALPLTLILLVTCSTNKTEEKNVLEPSPIDYEVAEDKSSLTAFYELDHMKEWYPQRILPPTYDYSVDIYSKSPTELWLMRNEIFARNGHLFDDAVLRGYFNQFKWYQPVFDVPEFKVQLNKDEQELVNRILVRENELKKGRYVQQDTYKMIDMDHVYNLMQFKEVPETMLKQLAKTNFVIVPAQHEQFFHVYDGNHYQYIPSFITTDIYLQVLHKHFSSILRRVEEDRFIPLLTDLLKSIYNQSALITQESTDESLKDAAAWTTTYVAIAYALLTEQQLPVPEEMAAYFDEDLDRGLNNEGSNSTFLQSPNYQFSQLKPRGNYTKTPELENYFRCMKWLNTAPLYIDEDERLLSAIVLASCIKRSEENLQSFQTFNEAIKFIVGEEDNLSVAHLISIITDKEAANPSLFNNPEKLEVLRGQLLAMDPDIIKPQAGNTAAAIEFSRPSVLFTAGRYTFDAEILSKLVHVLSPSPRRPFPKGLDVFAAFGHKEAENILLNEYQEEKHWAGYPTALSKLKQQFASFNNWDKNIYSKTFEMINALNAKNDKAPLFMKTPAWQRKNLVTSLAAWTELKHDMLLYSEQPWAAEAGEGGGPPPPEHIGYVEPNILFWKKALELLDLQESTLEKQGLMVERISGINDELRKIGKFLLDVSEKELANIPLSASEFDEISWMGGRIEYLTFDIFDSDHLPEKERLVALAADVYHFNNQYLEEATGFVDEIYVVVEINGKPYLTKGTVFSYYEFISTSPLTDEEWQQKILNGPPPKRPGWVKGNIIENASLESKPWFSF